MSSPVEDLLAATEYLTVAEIATVLRVSKMTAYRLIHDGQLEAIRVGRSFRVPSKAVRAYLSGATTTVDDDAEGPEVPKGVGDGWW